MRITATRILLAATLAIVPATLFAAAPPAHPVKPATHQAAKSNAADHATMGVVKSVNGTALTITRSGKDQGDMSFVLNASTKRDGKIEVGAPVSVRYREDGASHLATAITAQHGSASQHSSTAQQSSASQHSKPESTSKPQSTGKHQ